MAILSLILRVFALVLFVLAGLGVPASRFSMLGFGLACWVGAELLDGGAPR